MARSCGCWRLRQHDFAISSCTAGRSCRGLATWKVYCPAVDSHISGGVISPLELIDAKCDRVITRALVQLIADRWPIARFGDVLLPSVDSDRSMLKVRSEKRSATTF
jgi:hypothetical protein